MSRLRGAALLAAALVAWHGAFAAEPGGGLVAYRVVADGIPRPLTAVPGDPARGRAIAINSGLGNCLICHSAPMPEVPVFGTVGPPLEGVAGRLSEAQLRLRVVDTRRLNPASLMPAYYKVQGLQRVAPRYLGQPMLSAQEVEDVVAFLLTLR